MKALSVFLFTLLMAPVNALVTSATLSKLWSWFLVDDLGPSPSYGAWYGITTILFLLLGLALMNVTKTKVEDKDYLMHTVSQSIGVVVACAFSLLFSWVIGSVTGLML